MQLNKVTPPAETPISREELLQFLNLGDNCSTTQELLLFDSLIIAATELAEKQTGRLFITQTWDLWLDHWPSKPRYDNQGWWDGEREGPLSMIVAPQRYIEVPKPPLQEVVFLNTHDISGSVVEFDSSNYHVDETQDTARIALTQNAIWPGIVLRETQGIQVRFKAGYGDNPEDVPEAIRAAIKMIAGYLYENRGDTTKNMPFAPMTLLEGYRVMRI